MRVFFNHSVPYSAIEALFFVAVFASQLDKRLAVACVAAVNTGVDKERYYIIMFGRQLFEQAHGSVAEVGLFLSLAVSEEGWNDGIYEDDVNGVLSERFLFPCVALLSEVIMSKPIVGGADGEEFTQLVNIVGFKDSREEDVVIVPDCGYLREADVREVYRSGAQAFEEEAFDRLQLVFFAKEVIFSFKSCNVVVVADAVVVVVVELSGLTEQQRFGLQDVSAVLQNMFERQAFSEAFENVAVSAESESTHKSDVKCFVPVFSAVEASCFDVLRFSYEAFREQRCKPVGYLNGGDFAYLFNTSDGRIACQQPLDVSFDLIGRRHNHLQHFFAVGTIDLTVGCSYDVKNDIVIELVAVVPVQVPVGSALMNLYVTYPDRVSDAYLGIKEIRSGIGVDKSRVKNINSRAISCSEIVFVVEPVFPNIMQRPFHKSFNLFLQK